MSLRLRSVCSMRLHITSSMPIGMETSVIISVERFPSDHRWRLYFPIQDGWGMANGRDFWKRKTNQRSIIRLKDTS